MLDAVRPDSQPAPQDPKQATSQEDFEQNSEAFALTEEEIVSPKYDPLEAGLPGYIRQFGMAIEELQPYQIAMFVAARNLEPIIANLKIPMATREIRSDEKIVLEREVERDLEKTRYREEERSVDVPADRMDVSLIDDPQEISRILPSQWVTEEIAPEVFLKRLANRELLRADWREPWQKPETYIDKVKVREKYEQPVPPKIEKQHACVVMDISGSMAQQGRAIVAAGLGLAFLKQGHENRAKLMYRGFGGSPDPPIVGSTDEDFTNISRTIISQNFNRGDTNIQYALADTAARIQSEGEFAQADILLLSDGLSRLDSNPLGKVKLHSFIVNPKGLLDLPKELQGMLGKLRRWSKTFKYVATNEYESHTPPPISQDELDELEVASRAIPEELEHITDTQALNLARQRLRSLIAYMDNSDCEWLDTKRFNKIHASLKSELAKISVNDTEVIAKNKNAIEEQQREAQRQRAIAEQQRAANAARALNELRQQLAERNSNEEPINSKSLWQRIREFVSDLGRDINGRFNHGAQTYAGQPATDAESDRLPYFMRPHF